MLTTQFRPNAYLTISHFGIPSSIAQQNPFQLRLIHLTVRSGKQTRTRPMQILNDLDAQLFIIVAPARFRQALGLLFVPVNAAVVQMSVGQCQPKFAPEFGWCAALQARHHFHCVQPLIEVRGGVQRCDGHVDGVVVVVAVLARAGRGRVRRRCSRSGVCIQGVGYGYCYI